MIKKPITIEDVQIILNGIPARTTRGFLGYCTVSLLPFKERWLLFDTGHYGDRGILLDTLKNLKISPEDISYVILSHLHYDHCLNLPLFPHATVILSAKELQYAKEVSSGQQVDTCLPDVIDYLLKNRKVQTFTSELELNSEIKVFETPGHTPGSIALRIKRTSNIVLCGDAIKNAWEFTLGVSDMVCNCPPIDAQKSIEKIKASGEIFIPGHDRPFSYKEGKIEFLGEIDWSISADLYPRKKGEKVLKLG